MYKRLIVMALATTVALGLSNCSEKSVEPAPSNDDDNLHITDHFPNTVGSHWTYVLRNLDSSWTDTMTVEITDTLTLESGESATIWVYACSTGVDTAYAYNEADTIRTTSCKPQFGAMRIRQRTLVTPFVVGDIWGGKVFSDTVKVLEQTSISTPAGDFADAFLVDRTWGPAFNSSGHHESWFVPGVGLVKKIRQEGGWYFYGTETWELVAYEIAE